MSLFFCIKICKILQTIKNKYFFEVCMEKGSVELTQNILDKLNNNSDVVCRNLLISGKKIDVVYIKDISSYEIISQDILLPLSRVDKLDENVDIDYINKSVLTAGNIDEVSSADNAVEELLKGKTILAMEDCQKMLVIDSTKFNTRSIEEPPTSAVLKGPREGFNENIKTNVSMVRRRMATTNLVMVDLNVGTQTSTAVTVMYLKNIADKSVVKAIVNKIKSINIDGVVDSNYIAEYLQNRKNSIFQQIGTSEKPDIVTAKLLEGRVAIFVDGSPIVLTLPFILFETFQSPSDYYAKHQHSTLARWIRLIGIFFAVILPGFFVSVQLYHYDIVPLKFLVTIMNTTAGLPFTPLFETLFIILLFEILNEASVRMPKHLGMAMSIVGALILGETAVKAGLISPPAMMIVALSGITLFVVSDLSDQLSILRLGFTLLGGLLGLYGIILGGVFLIAYLNTIDSYGAPYLSPLSPHQKSDMKDFFNMAPITEMKSRPKSFHNKNTVRKEVQKEVQE